MFTVVFNAYEGLASPPGRGAADVSHLPAIKRSSIFHPTHDCDCIRSCSPLLCAGLQKNLFVTCVRIIATPHVGNQNEPYLTKVNLYRQMIPVAFFIQTSTAEEPHHSSVVQPSAVPIRFVMPGRCRMCDRRFIVPPLELCSTACLQYWCCCRFRYSNWPAGSWRRECRQFTVRRNAQQTQPMKPKGTNHPTTKRYEYDRVVLLVLLALSLACHQPRA